MIADRRPPPEGSPVPARAGSALGARLDVRGLGVAGVHLAALSSLAIAQPLFDVVAENATFLAVRQSTAFEIVAFALIVTLAPAAALLLAEALAGLVDHRLRHGLHLLFVVGLVSMVALQALKRTELERATVLAGLAALAGIAGAAVYARSRLARSFLTVLGAAPLLFLALFLFGSPVRGLLFAEEASARPQGVSATAPVVMIVFDEFSVASLMDRTHRVDPVRYPNFAKFARGATWYRNAVSVSPWTDRAVPSILTGNLPEAERLPVYREHPRNLFTLLAESHDLRVHEWITTLCPRDLCPERSRAAVSSGLQPLLSDLGIVYLHVLLPESVALRVPAVTETWGDFRGEGGARPEDSPAAEFDAFLDSVGRARKPPLNFLHVALPHFPWRYLPSGEEYLHRFEFVPGVESERWKSDAWLARQGEQRYLLQVGYVDRLIGRLMARLRSAGLYDRALVVLTADHGVSFRPGDGRRRPTATNAHDLAFVPLFVKAPGQKRGRVVDRPLQTTDILPTLAELLGVRLPWSVDGRNALASRDGRSEVWFHGETYEPEDLESRRDAALAERIAVFGAGEGWDRVFRLGPNRELIGREAAALRKATSTVRAVVDDEESFALVDRRSAFVPSYVAGRLEGDGAAPLQPLAVAVNGRVAAVTRSYSAGDAVRFGAIVPPETFRDGENEVAVYAVTRTGAAIALARLGETGRAPTFELTQDGGGEVLVSTDGRRVRVREGALSGHVDWVAVEGDRATFVGWAADLGGGRPRERVAVFADGRFVASFSAPVPRPDLGEDVVDAGFSFVLPLSALTGRSRDPEVRVFGVLGDVASELAYPDGYPWR